MIVNDLHACFVGFIPLSQRAFLLTLFRAGAYDGCGTPKAALAAVLAALRDNLWARGSENRPSAATLRMLLRQPADAVPCSGWLCAVAPYATSTTGVLALGDGEVTTW